MKTIAIALGGNALIKEHQIGRFEQQMQNVKRACNGIAKLSKKGYKIVLTHGNGPQVGNLEVKMQSVPELPSMPLHVDVAMTQGQIGYMILQALEEILPKKKIAALVTQVKVEEKDIAFSMPSKPIGKSHSYEKAQEMKLKGIQVIETKKGFRKVVASPEPKKIVELNTVKEYLKKTDVLIACGGGGIPVIRKGKTLQGTEAVIDKDKATQLLANSLKIKELYILTDVENVYLNYKNPESKALYKVKAKKLKEYLKKGMFAIGTMKPKIEASINFLEKGGKKAVICHLEKVEEAVKGKTGTVIEK